MKVLFLSPHNDDEALYGAFTLIRHQPLVAVVTDGARHERRYGIKAAVRRLESAAACEILGSKVAFLGIPDDELTVLNAEDAIRKDLSGEAWDLVYAPAWHEDGNPEHNIVSVAAKRVFGTRVVQYTTYTKGEFKTIGRDAVYPTEYELIMKRRALDCYKSQHQVNGAYFDAARNGAEYLEQ